MASFKEAASTKEACIDFEKEETHPRVSSSLDGNVREVVSTGKEVEKQEETDTAPVVDTELEWITGFKLWAVMFGISIASFIMLLDTAIIITVRAF